MASPREVILEFLEQMEDRIESLYEATRPDPASIHLLELMSALDHAISRVHKNT